MCIRRNARGTTRGTRHTRATCPRSHRRCCRTRTRRLRLLPPRRHLRRRQVSYPRLAPSPPSSPPSQPPAVRTCALTRTSSARQSYPNPSHPRVSRPTVPRRARRTDDASADRCSSLRKQPRRRVRSTADAKPSRTHRHPSYRRRRRAWTPRGRRPARGVSSSPPPCADTASAWARAARTRTRRIRRAYPSGA